MIRSTALRAIIAAAVVVLAILLLAQVLLSLSFLTTAGWAVAWIVAIAAGAAVYIGLGRRPRHHMP